MFLFAPSEVYKKLKQDLEIEGKLQVLCHKDDDGNRYSPTSPPTITVLSTFFFLLYFSYFLFFCVLSVARFAKSAALDEYPLALIGS